MTTSASETDLQRVKRTIERERAAITAGDSPAYFSLLTDDAVFMPPNLPAKTGAALRAWLDEFLRGVSVEWLDFAHGETVVAGDLACHPFTCAWRVTPRAGGQATELHFKGLHVLRRGPDGSWKIHREIWNQDPRP